MGKNETGVGLSFRHPSSRLSDFEYQFEERTKFLKWLLLVLSKSQMK